MTGQRRTGPRLTGAGSGDAARLAALHAACFAEGWPAASIATLLDTPGTAGLVAECGAPPAAAGLVLWRVAADEAEILTLGVVPARRRGGLGRALLDAAETLAAAAGARRMFLEVAADNAAARALYARAGYAPAGRRPGYYARRGAPAADALVLARRLGGGAETVPPVSQEGHRIRSGPDKENE